MSHTSRSRRRANEARRERAAAGQEPLPPEEQQKRADNRMARKQTYWREVGCDRPTYADIPPTTPSRPGPRLRAFGWIEALLFLTRRFR